MSYKVPQLIPYLGEEEISNLEKAVKNKWITEGPFAEKFVEEIKRFTGVKYAVLAPNGTLGLYLSLLAMGIKSGDEVIVPDFTFVASGTSVVFSGAKPVFVDVNRKDYHILVDQIENSITENTKAIMPVHIYGQCAEMAPILEIAKKYKIKVIEDAAQSLGVFYSKNNRLSVSPYNVLDKDIEHTGTIGDIGVISFFADKTITMGEGAVVLTNDADIFEKLKLIRNQGRLSSGTFIHPHVGMNFRVTDLQCAVGVAQLSKYDEISQKKISNYMLYKKQLEHLENIVFVNELEYCNFVPFRAPITVEDLNGLTNYLESKSIQTRGFFYPMHKQPCFTMDRLDFNRFKNSNKLYETGLAFPVYPDLTELLITYICDTIIEFYNNN